MHLVTWCTKKLKTRVHLMGLPNSSHTSLDYRDVTRYKRKQKKFIIKQLKTKTKYSGVKLHGCHHNVIWGKATSIWTLSFCPVTAKCDCEHFYFHTDVTDFTPSPLVWLWTGRASKGSLSWCGKTHTEEERERESIMWVIGSSCGGKCCLVGSCSENSSSRVM